ncbi:MAG: YraN family protein [Planctomycetales bacterium]|nr:YraN family protein [Planctomycetales bacterium]
MSLTASVSTWFRQRWQPLSLGERGEKQAARYLRRLGYKILFTRHRSRYGEFDILAVDGQTVVFVEVKTRRNTSDDRPAEAVDAHRQARLTRAALAFLKAHRLLEYPSRFDVIEVHWPKLEKRPAIQHLRNAFPPASRNQFFS